MRALIERIEKASCIIDGKVHSSVSHGLLVYVAFTENDNIDTLNKMASKIFKLRIFEDENHKMNKALSEINGSILLISSFSLYGDTKGMNRPSFIKSLGYNEAKPLYDEFISIMNNFKRIETGIFGADMKIEAINDGPVSIIIDI